MHHGDPPLAEGPTPPSEGISAEQLVIILRAYPALLERFGTAEELSSYLDALAARGPWIRVVDSVADNAWSRLFLFNDVLHKLRWEFRENRCSITKPQPVDDQEATKTLHMRKTFTKAVRDHVNKHHERYQVRVEKPSPTKIAKWLQQLTFAGRQELTDFLKECDSPLHDNDTLPPSLFFGREAMTCVLVGDAVYLCLPVSSGEPEEAGWSYAFPVLPDVRSPGVAQDFANAVVSVDQRKLLHTFLDERGIGNIPPLQGQARQGAEVVLQHVERPEKPSPKALVANLNGNVFASMENLRTALQANNTPLEEAAVTAHPSDALAVVVVENTAYGLVPQLPQNTCAVVPLDLHDPEQVLRIAMMGVFAYAQMCKGLEGCGMTLLPSIEQKKMTTDGKISFLKVAGKESGEILNGTIEHGPSVFHIGHRIPYNAQHSLSEARAFVQRPDGKLWIVTQASVYEIVLISEAGANELKYSWWPPGWLKWPF